MSRPEGLLSARERREVLSLKLRAWSGKPRLRDNEKSAKAPAVGAAPGGPPPPPPVRSRISFLNTPWEEFERLRVDLGPRQVLVPEVVLITGGSTAWRCTEVP